MSDSPVDCQLLRLGASLSLFHSTDIYGACLCQILVLMVGIKEGAKHQGLWSGLSPLVLCPQPLGVPDIYTAGAYWYLLDKR